ncbi:MAG: hypothetical protein ACK5HT_11500 [Draconibacterium sp.]
MGYLITCYNVVSGKLIKSGDWGNANTVYLAYPMLILNDGDLLTMFLTGGLLLVILILASLNALSL